MIESGFERVTFAPGRTHDVRRPLRWWLYLHLDDARPQAPRRGVVDRGFRFARGGLASIPAEAKREIENALAEARLEWETWTHQPSHALGPGGILIPLDEVLPQELRA